MEDLEAALVAVEEVASGAEDLVVLAAEAAAVEEPVEAGSFTSLQFLQSPFFPADLLSR